MKSLAFTLKVCPVVTLLTIGLCYLTQVVAGWFGIVLPDQQNVEIVRSWMTNAFASWRNFSIVTILVLQILVLMPVVEELLFRGLLFKVACKVARKRLFDYLIIAFSSALFSSAHYVQQPWPDSAFLALFFFGVSQCWIYRKTDCIWCVMLNHALFNLTNLVLLLLV